MQIVTAYVEEEVAQAIEAACSTGKSKSEVIKEILKSHLLSKHSYELTEARAILEELTQEKQKKELEMIDLEKRVISSQFKVEELENAVSQEWVRKQLDDVILATDKPDDVIPEFNRRIGNLSEPWLKAKVDAYLKSGGNTEIEALIRRNSEIAKS